METQTLSSKYKEDGFLSPVSVFSTHEIGKYQLAFENMEKAFEKKREEYLNPHLYFSWAKELATHPALLDIIESILGSELFISGSLIINKIPGTYSHLSWHQDAYHFQGYNSEPYITAWIALTHSNVANGCMRVIPGSHHQGIVPHLPFSDDTNMLKNRGVEVKISPSVNEIRDIVLKPGEMSLHDGRLIHQSNPNQTMEKRIGFIVRFVTPLLKNISSHPLLQVRGNGALKFEKAFNQSSMEEEVQAYLEGNKEL